MKIQTHDDLRALYGQPKERAVKKEIPALDRHCRDFIALSPFVLLATGNAQHQLDASPRGGDPGFVKVTPEGELLLPDAPGNNRLDSLENILATGEVGLLFLIPGFEETLRVNGRVTLSTAPADIAACTTERRAPKLVLRVQVAAAYLHCAKAFMRSRLWEASSQVDRAVMPTMGQMIADQAGIDIAPETQQEMARRYAADL
jgi:PPOX class probable FMN-dependent enzyme